MIAGDASRVLDTIRPALHLLRLAVFSGLALLALRIAWKRRAGGDERRAVVDLVTYALVVSCLAGFTQIESWPFSNWALVHHTSRRTFNPWRYYGVDRTGRPFEIDARFVEPLPFEDFNTWLRQQLLTLDRPRTITLDEINPRTVTPRQVPVARFLLARAEAARGRFLAGGSIGTNGRFLGSFAAPYHFARPRVWKTSADVPPTPFVRFQIWQEEWDVEERFRDETKVRRRLIFDYGS